MQQSGGVNRCHRAAELQPDACRFGGVEAMFAFQQPLERLALHQLHPEPDLIVDLRGAVDGDHVRMADACEHPPFLDDAAPAIRVRRRRRQQLQRHLPVETGIPGAIDRPVRPASQDSEDLEMAPPRAHVSRRPPGIGRCRANVRAGLGLAMQMRQSFEQTQLLNRPSRLRIGERFEGIPVHGSAIEDRLRHRLEAVRRGHDPFAQRALSTRVRLPSAPPRRLAFRGPPPAPRTSSPSRGAR